MGKAVCTWLFFLHMMIEGCFILSIKSPREFLHRERMYWNRFIFLHRDKRDSYQVRYIVTGYWISFEINLSVTINLLDIWTT